MPPKTPVAIISRATTSRDKDTSMVDSSGLLDSQVVIIRELKEIVEYINNNT